MRQAWVVVAVLGTTGLGGCSSRSDCEVFTRKMTEYAARKSGRTLSDEQYAAALQSCRDGHGNGDQADLKCVIAANDDASIEACFKAAGFDPDAIVPRASADRSADCALVGREFERVANKLRDRAPASLAELRTSVERRGQADHAQVTAAFDNEQRAAHDAETAVRAAANDAGSRPAAFTKLKLYIDAVHASDVAYVTLTNPTPSDGDAGARDRNARLIEMKLHQLDRAAVYKSSLAVLERFGTGCAPF